MSSRHKRHHERALQTKYEDKRYSIPRWRSQAIGTRSRGPKKITLPKIAMQEAKA
jgi:hypothetical protein